jgi:hypothetical protein
MIDVVALVSTLHVAYVLCLPRIAQQVGSVMLFCAPENFSKMSINEMLEVVVFWMMRDCISVVWARKRGGIGHEGVGGHFQQRSGNHGCIATALFDLLQ